MIKTKNARKMFSRIMKKKQTNKKQPKSALSEFSKSTRKIVETEEKPILIAHIYMIAPFSILE